MPGPYSSYITAVQGIYKEVLLPILFPNETRPALALDEISTTGPDGGRQSPPYVLMFDMGSDNKWTFMAHPQGGANKGNSAIIRSEFRLEVYDFDLGNCDRILNVILWNGQPPNARAGLAFASLSIALPQSGIAGWVIPTRSNRGYSGVQYNDQRVHVVRQWFEVGTSISGDGLAPTPLVEFTPAKEK